MTDYDENDRISICLLLYIFIGQVVKWLITVSGLLVNVQKSDCRFMKSIEVGEIIMIFFLLVDINSAIAVNCWENMIGNDKY